MLGLFCLARNRHCKHFAGVRFAAVHSCVASHESCAQTCDATHESCAHVLQSLVIRPNSQSRARYGVATTCRLLKIIGLFCKRAL